MECELRLNMLKEYLQQQVPESFNRETDDIKSFNANDARDEDIEVLKQQVRMWLKLDDVIKQLKQVVKDKQSEKQVYTETIIEFMQKYNYEELNTKQGKIHFKVNNVKSPLSQKMLKTRLIEYHDPNISKEDLLKAMFENRNVVEKPTLRKVTIK